MRPAGAPPIDLYAVGFQELDEPRGDVDDGPEVVGYRDLGAARRGEAGELRRPRDGRQVERESARGKKRVHHQRRHGDPSLWGDAQPRVHDFRHAVVLLVEQPLLRRAT